MAGQIAVFALLITLALGTQYVPIPDFYDGIHVGEHSAKLHIEAFYDLLCPDSKASNALLNQVFSETDISNVKFTYHIFPLPYHIQAYVAAIGVRYFVNKFDTQAVAIYINHLFDQQDSFSGSVTYNKTQAQVVRELAENVHAHFQAYPQYKFEVNDLQTALGNRQYDLESRTSWKYGCSRGISGTPIFLANGVVLDGAESWQADDWKTFIEIKAGSTQFLQP